MLFSPPLGPFLGPPLVGLEPGVAIYIYIYIYNIKIKYLQHTSEISEILKIYNYNIYL